MNNDRNTVLAGRINKLFGTGGGLMISLYPAFPEDFDPSTMPFFVEIDALDVPLWCERFERRGISGAVVEFADFDTERRAQELIGREFRMTEADDDDDEFYLEDLIGFAIEAEEFSQSAEEPRCFSGTISDYYDSELNPLFELDIEGRRVLVPAAEEFIAHIDFEEGTMKMILPEGLIDL